jgi:phosphatidylglycerophosphate synthase
VLTVHAGLSTGSVAHLATVGALAATVGLGPAGWLVGVGYAVVVVALLARGLRRSGTTAFGPADLVTSARSALVGGVAALVADSFARPVPVAVLTGLAAVALLLDAVDGRIARRTGTVSAVGARFDMEVDSVLVLLLALYTARALGAWVVLLGCVHYGLLLARRLLPWLREPTPPRYWCKVVAAVQGVVLTVTAAGVLPEPVAVLALVGVAALLVESFGREVWWLWTHRAPDTQPSGLLAAAGTVLALLLVYAVLVVPDRVDRLAPLAFLRIPVEGLVLVGLVLALPARRRRVVAAVGGALLGLLAVVRIFDLAFYEAVHRPFNPVNDWRLLPPAVDMLGESFGEGWADAAVVGAGVLVVALPVVVALAVVRICRVAARRRAFSTRAVAALGAAWLVALLLGAQLTPRVPVASRSVAELAATQVADAVHNVRDIPVFRAELAAADPWSTVPAENLLTGLRGKDVVLVFVESYGRVAVEGSSFAPDIRALLDDGTQDLADAGFGARSGFLTSSTYGGISWLAHATLHSGLWIDSQQRHDQLLESDRFTLSAAFARAGWRTVVDVPSNRDPWDEGRAFYRFDADYDRHDVGYEGPKFSFAAMPDQYTLAAFERLELDPGHAPVMAEIDLISSHEPWTPLPRMVDWDDVGDGTVYRPMPAEGLDPADVVGDTDRIRALYAESIEYSLTALLSWLTTFHADDDDLVVIMLGDHQPASVVTGPDASHDVPISILARDPAVLDAVAPWGWDEGLLPAPDAPLWRMDQFRDRFLAAFGPAPTAVSNASAPR